MKKTCEICGNIFETKPKGSSRKYCFICSLEIKKGETAITYIRKAIKYQLIKYKGGRCERCGYDKNVDALCFHHIDPATKSFEISNYAYFTIRPMEEYYQEVDKCELLCLNCHAEEHSTDD